MSSIIEEESFSNNLTFAFYDQKVQEWDFIQPDIEMIAEQSETSSENAQKPMDVEKSEKLHPQIPDRYIHLSNDLFVGVTEFLGYLKVHLQKFVIKNDRYIPTKTGIILSPYHWQVLSDNISTLNLKFPHASLMIERKLFLSVTNTSVVFQHVFNLVNGSMQLSDSFLSITHKQFHELCNVMESISSLIQKKLLGPLFLKAIQEVFVIPSDDDDIQQDELGIRITLQNNLIRVLKKHIRREVSKLKIMCEGCSNVYSLEHTCFETLLGYLNRCIFSIDIQNVAHDFVYANSDLYLYMTKNFIENLNALEIFQTCRNHLSVNL